VRTNTTPERRLRIALIVSLAVAFLAGAAILYVLITAQTAVWIGNIRIGVSRVWRAAAFCAAAVLCVRLILHRIARDAQESRGVPAGFAISALIVSVVLSFGPVILSRGRTVAFGPYAWLHEYVPGFNGLRVPARFGMVAFLFLALLAGAGAAALLRRAGRYRVALAAALSTAVMLESHAAPIAINAIAGEKEVATPMQLLRPYPRSPAIYRRVRELPDDAVLVHFPFGYEQYELRYMFYSTSHWRRILNGYSGGFPGIYGRHRGTLMRPFRDPDLAITVLRESGATHAVVHLSAFLDNEGGRVRDWLISNGAVEVDRVGDDVLLALPK
jgi:hypothetical protein